MPDTILIISGTDSGACGYDFKVGSQYIVYGESWKRKSVVVGQQKNKTKRRIIEVNSTNTFFTDICRLTQEANKRELDRLKSATE